VEIGKNGPGILGVKVWAGHRGIWMQYLSKKSQIFGEHMWFSTSQCPRRNLRKSARILASPLLIGYSLKLFGYFLNLYLE
jgi:hypothetical protein